MNNVLIGCARLALKGLRVELRNDSGTVPEETINQFITNQLISLNDQHALVTMDKSYDKQDYTNELVMKYSYLELNQDI